MDTCGLIFDFNGVIADSEVVASTAFAKYVIRLGLPTTLDDALSHYVGKGWREVTAMIEEGLGKKLPVTFISEVKAAILEHVRANLREMSGATMFIRHFAELPRCIASSSPLNYLRVCLGILRLTTEFGDNVFSADMVARGKPHPDISSSLQLGKLASPQQNAS